MFSEKHQANKRCPKSRTCLELGLDFFVRKSGFYSPAESRARIGRRKPRAAARGKK